MSLQAIAWVIEQDIPSRAKQVLFALANRADHETGHCWPSIETIMRESSCSRRGVFNFLGALERNGFLEIKRVLGKDGRTRSNEYWILFDRQPAKWTHSGNKVELDEDDEENNSPPPDNPETSALCAPSPEPDPKPLCAPPSSSVCTPVYEPSDSNRQSPEQVEGRRLKSQPPKVFSSNKRSREFAALQAADEAKRRQHIPVIQGSEPWNAWVKHGHSPGLVGTIEVNGRRDRGWYFPTLYPPKETGPPDTAAASPPASPSRKTG
jgi:hypothetical protein